MEKLLKENVYKFVQDWIRTSGVRGYITPTTDPFDYGFKVELFNNKETSVNKVFGWSDVSTLLFTSKPVKTFEDVASFLENELQKMYESIKE